MSDSNPKEKNLESSLSSLKKLIQLSQSIINTIPSVLNHHQSHTPLPSQTTSSSTFFYQNCPSVVSLPLPLTLPPFLDKHQNGFLSQTPNSQFLPSECMFVKTETDAWVDFPSHYSRIVRRVLLFLASSANVISVVSRWVFVNSPISIDVSVRDHLVLLLRFCFTPIVTEARGLEGGDFDQFYLQCPVLCQVLGWYAAQVGILFGEINAKLFAIRLFKHLILNVTIDLLMFSDKTIESSKDDFDCDGEISISQVQQAVAAFRQRSLLEQNMKAVGYSRQLNCSQRAVEHEYISKRAEEERLKRPDYQPIIEHDLFSWQRGRNKDTSVTKSREELLAEERDYKRRRMSYRGKKIKRTTTQVMRDIIEQYTEEIKAAGGFGHLQHVAEESGQAASDLPVVNTSADNVMEKGQTNSSDAGSAPTYNRTQSNSYKANRSTKIADQYPKDLDQFKRNHRYDRNHNSKSPEKPINNGRTGTIEQNSVRGQHDVTQVHKKSSRRSPERNNSSYREHSRHRKERFNGNDDKSRYERSLGRSHKSDSVAHKKFKDRYDPSESWNTDEDNL